MIILNRNLFYHDANLSLYNWRFSEQIDIAKRKSSGMKK